MIQNISTLCNTNYNYLFPEMNNLFDNENYQQVYDDLLNQSLDNKSLVCPKCKSNDFSIHSQYTRYIVDTPQQQINDDYYTLNVKVVYCHYCKSYHAFLPATIPAFSHFSYHFIFSVLYFYHTHKNHKQTYLLFNITKHTLNVFINKVGAFFLRTMKSNYINHLKHVMKSNRDRRKFFTDFLMRFFLSQSTCCTLEVFFGKPLFLSIIILNLSEP